MGGSAAEPPCTSNPVFPMAGLAAIAAAPKPYFIFSFNAAYAPVSACSAAFTCAMTSLK